MLVPEKIRLTLFQVLRPFRHLTTISGTSQAAQVTLTGPIKRSYKCECVLRKCEIEEGQHWANPVQGNSIKPTIIIIIEKENELG